ncbi:MAG: hypothetical protein FWH49_04025 [Clostridiales bacterium]|nr:hypothetical protein [Clostridiales bacterium]
MLRVAVSTSGASVESTVPERFAEATHLLIIDAETDEVLQVVEGEGADDLERSMFFAGKTVEFDCEALLCGELEPEPFAVIAEENCITRYDATHHKALESVHLMNAFALPLITDFAGGTGCPDNDPANCELDHDHEQTH